MRRKLSSLFLGSLVLVALGNTGVWAEEPEQLLQRVESSVKKASLVGKRTVAWQGERQQLIEDIQNLELKLAWAEFQLEKTEKWLVTENNNIAILQKNLSRAAATRENIAPLLEVLYEELEKHVESDLPFQQEERMRRLAHVRSTLDDPGSQLSDKLGRLLDAMQVELDYGYSVEATEELVEDTNGTRMQATVFRLGRLALFRLLGDGSRLERYNSATEEWQELPARSVFEVKKAVEIARKKRVSSLLFLPVGPLGELSHASAEDK
ncbi:DUF3450 domain-containing protein [Desulfocapsa sp. AH-315-G09]|nr:DUF3450 domain-containing protein [Desulfocapsa sp.]MBN4063973.1 DUF3450 domain-containing protein [bacterium AH-315-I07]MBN4065151.1 DUF3450 domain-containing protein [Desulfocapsa sp. AH-315-G09]